MNADKVFEDALQHHRAGRHTAAEELYRQILGANPDHADALHMLGVLAYQSARTELARDLIGRSIALRPNIPAAHANLGRVLQVRGQLADAIKCYEQALHLQPNDPDFQNLLGAARSAEGNFEAASAALQAVLAVNPKHVAALNNLGNLRRRQNRRDEAVAFFQRALAIEPKHVEALHNLGNCFRESGAIDQAIASYRRALEMAPNHGYVLTHLGSALEERGEVSAAIECHQRASALRPNDTEPLIRLGNVLMNAGQPAAAIPIYGRAILLQPGSVVAQYDLGCALKEAGRLDEAIPCFQRALTLEPGFAEAANNLGSTFKALARLDEALASFQRALAIRPDFGETYDNFVYTMYFHCDRGPADISAALGVWNDRYARTLSDDIRPHHNDRSSRRRLRIGYVSPDFRDHVVGRNVLPILKRHDRERFEIFCYSNAASSDPITEQFQVHCDTWRDISRVSDADAAKMVRRDGIDILVDLALHMSDNRLMVFARKPAPVQATWAGYPGTTGLETIDYRITDPHLDPPGQGDDFYSEQSIRLPDSFWCYDPLGTDLPVSELPAQSRAQITFGCLNNFCKVNEPTLKLWAAVLREVDASRFILLAPEGSARQWVLSVLGAENIAAQRIEFRTPRPRLEYLKLYHEFDIALDTFPYNGHTTSLDALWMGVPVVTIRGNSPVSRAGFSQLKNLGHEELAGESSEQFVAIARGLAADVPGLSELRRGLRRQMERSLLMDSGRFAKALESCYREMWKRYCEGL